MSKTSESSAASSAGPATGPVTERERIITLDVLRGFALFGILMVNMPFFAMPFILVFFDPSLAEGPIGERLAFSLVKLFFEYKFISLFSLLFGIGFVVQLTRATARGGSFIPQYLRRIIILFLIGFIHAIGLWYGDILLMYSIAAVVLLFCASLSSRTLFILAIVSLLIGTVLSFGINGLQYVATEMGVEQAERSYAQAEEVLAGENVPSGFNAIEQAQFDPNNPIWTDAELRAYRDGPLSDALAFRSITYAFALIFAAFGYGWHVLAMFLLGAAMMKSNFFAPEKRHWHRRLALIALPIGLLLEGIVTAAHWMAGHEASLGVMLTLPLHELGSVLLMLGYVGAICLIVHAGLVKWLTTPIAAAGRMALTVYLSMTIITTGIMYWWGLGWFGSFNRVELIGLVIIIYAALVIFSVLWLKAFRFGPLEWLWRVMTYLKLQPIRRA